MANSLQALTPVERALAAWVEYEKTHDLTPYRGMAVTIDLETHELHFGWTHPEIEARLRAEGRLRPSLWSFVRQGRPRRLSTRWRRRVG